jgi:LCP family protein required for cell wall assembly
MEPLAEPPESRTGVSPYPARPGVQRTSRSRHVGRWVVRGLIVVLLVAIVLAGLGLHRASDFGSAISSRAPFSMGLGFLSGRTNLVVLGYGGGSHDGANLTDSLLVISLNPSDGATTLISVPRDLWVQVPPNSGSYAKINTAYQNGLISGFGGVSAGRDAGGAEAASKVSEVLGMPVSNFLTIDFTGFRDLVDALGGVDINVPTAFTARYPRNDNPAIDPGWKIIHFNRGMQHMNGEQAIEYARARYVLDPPSEGTDFARSLRQQLLLRAILDRARQPSAWPKLLDATTALQRAIYTNLSLLELTLFSEKLDLTHAARIGLSDQNVLVDAQSSDGQDILLPANGDWGTIQQYVAQQIKP